MSIYISGRGLSVNMKVIPINLFVISSMCSSLFYAQGLLAEELIIENFQEAETVQPLRDYSGHRIGLGITYAGYLDKTMYVVDYGYEFNRYIGLMISASQYDKSSNSIENGESSSINDAVYTRLGLDLGYTFSNDYLDLKPYLLTGLINLNESNTLTSESQVLFQYGLGLRLTSHKGIYIDASYRNANVKNWLEDGAHRDGDEALLSLGYKF